MSKVTISDNFWRRAVHCYLYKEFFFGFTGNTNIRLVVKQKRINYRTDVKLTFFSNYQLLTILKYTKHNYMFDSVAQWWGFWLTPDQRPVVRRPISSNPALNFNTGFFFFCLKAFSRIIFPLLFRAFNHLIADQKN